MSSLPPANPAVLPALQGNGATPHKTTSADKAKEMGQEFESTFLSTVLAQMFTGLDGEGPLGSGNGAGSDTWRGMLTEQYASQISANGGIGLADHVTQELLKLQEGNNNE